MFQLNFANRGFKNNYYHEKNKFTHFNVYCDVACSGTEK